MMNQNRWMFPVLALVVILTAQPLTSAGLDPEVLLIKEKIAPKGSRYKAVVPDTLDLAERARFGVNGNIGNIDPTVNHTVRFMFAWAKGNVCFPIDHTFNLPLKNMRALPYLRTICGSDQGLDIELGTMREFMNQMGDDGLIYYPFGGEGVPKDTSYTYTQGLFGLAAQIWMERDGNAEWKKWLDMGCRGLKKMAIRVEDRAYFPPESGMKRDGTWHFTTRAGAGQAMFPYNPPEEPTMEQQGFEQCTKYEQSSALRALVKDYLVNGNQESIELADRIARFMMKPSLWVDTSAEGYLGSEHGFWIGHSHGHITAFIALLDYAIARRDDKLKQTMREAYDHLVRTGTIRIGWTPYWITPEKHGKPAFDAIVCDGCQPGDTVVLAVKLSDAGMGDYWDDVDATVRNTMVEQQIVDLDKMREVSDTKPGTKEDKLLQQFLGGSTGAEPTVLQPGPIFFGCCTPNNMIGLYYAWHGITRFDRGVATVNLFLNRASDWMDIDSYLPYEGKVVLHNKKAHSALVRIPNWLLGEKIQCSVNGSPAEPALVGNRLLFEGLKPGDMITLEFAVPERTDTYMIAGKMVTIKFRGSTVMDIGPKETEQHPSWPNPQWWGLHQIYERDYLKKDKAPMKEITRYVADKILPLQ